jgi:hypothetical protein
LRLLSTQKSKPSEIVLAEKLLTEYYKEPVLPVSSYCNSFRTWANALRQYAKETTYGANTQQIEKYGDPRLHKIVEMLGDIEIAITKSNLLARLIYGGEELRTEQCPIHKGRWSGCRHPACPMCHDGLNITGWVRPELTGLFTLVCAECKRTVKVLEDDYLCEECRAKA